MLTSMRLNRQLKGQRKNPSFGGELVKKGEIRRGVTRGLGGGREDLRRSGQRGELAGDVRDSHGVWAHGVRGSPVTRRPGRRPCV